MLNIVEFRVIVQMSVANNKVTLGWYMPKKCEQGLAVSLEDIVVVKVVGHFVKLYPFVGNQGKDIGFERDRNTVLLLEFWGNLRSENCLVSLAFKLISIEFIVIVDFLEAKDISFCVDDFANYASTPKFEFSND